MKKAFFLAMIIFLLISCAAAPIPVKPISQDDLNELKGEWTGKRHSEKFVNRMDLKIY
jgi:lipocalin